MFTLLKLFVGIATSSVLYSHGIQKTCTIFLDNFGANVLLSRNFGNGCIYDSHAPLQCPLGKRLMSVGWKGLN